MFGPLLYRCLGRLEAAYLSDEALIRQGQDTDGPMGSSLEDSVGVGSSDTHNSVVHGRGGINIPGKINW